MAERRSAGELIGETLREAGILVLVFGLLDAFVRDNKPPSIVWTSWVVGLGLFGIVVGCILELRSPK